MFNMKQLLKHENLLGFTFLAFVASIPFQIRMVYFTENSHLGQDYLFYNTLFLYLSDVILIFISLFFVFGLIQGKFHVKQSRIVETLLWFSGIAILSIFVSRETIGSIQLFGLFKLFIGILLFICLSASTSPISHSFKYPETDELEEDRSQENTEKPMFHVKHWFLWLILAISVFQAIIGITQYFSQESIGLGFLGEEYLRTYLPGVAKFQIPGAEKWVFDRIFDVSYGTNLVMRPYGTFSHPNVFGAFMFFSSLISLYLLYVSRETWKRGVFSAVLFLQIFCGFLSFSRVAVLSWIIAILFWFLLVRFRGNTKSDISRPQLIKAEGWKELKNILSTVIIASAISVALLFPQYLDRGGVVSYGTTNEEAISDRALYQKIAIEMIKARPLVGVGYQSFALQMDNYSLIKLENHQHQPVHNIYLLIAAETGLLGLAAFMIFVFFVLIAGWKKRKNLLVATFLSVFIMLLIIGLFDHYPITIQQGRLMLFLSAGIIVGLSVPRNKAEQGISKNQQILPLNT